MKFKKEFLIVGGGIALLAIVAWSMMTAKSPANFVKDTHIPAKSGAVNEMPEQDEQTEVNEPVFEAEFFDEAALIDEMGGLEELDVDITFDDIEL